VSEVETMPIKQGIAKNILKWERKQFGKGNSVPLAPLPLPSQKSARIMEYNICYNDVDIDTEKKCAATVNPPWANKKHKIQKELLVDEMKFPKKAPPKCLFAFET